MDGKTQAAAAAASGMSLRTAREWDTGRCRRRRNSPAIGGPVRIRLRRCGSRTSSRCCGATSRASSKRSWCWRCCARATRSSFTRGRRGRCSGAFATGGRGTASSPRCSSSKSPCPGREAAIDFTHATDLGVTIAGDPFPHLLFEFVLSYSHWTWVAVAFGETFEALAAGVQGALWALGGVPAVLRSDNLSAATHELKASSGRDLTPRFRAVLEHYGMRSSRITPGRAHENGVAEQAHRRLKSLVAQALLVRGHAAFDDLAAYERLRPGGRRVLAQSAGGGAPGRGAAGAPRPALGRDSQLHDLLPGRAAVEHDSRGASHVLRARAVDGPHGRSPRASQCRRGPLPRPGRADDAAAAQRGRAPHRLPPCHRLVGAQARRVCAVPLSRGPVSVGHVPARVRRVGADARRARRRRVPADPAPGRDRRRSAGGRRSSQPCSIRSAASTTSRCKRRWRRRC